MAHTPNPQRAKWIFVLNNYDPLFQFKNYLQLGGFDIKRAVWGYEESAEGIPHVQGYVEFNRSYRLVNVRRLFSDAHWEVALGNSKQNFDYATKVRRY